MTSVGYHLDDRIRIWQSDELEDMLYLPKMSDRKQLANSEIIEKNIKPTSLLFSRIAKYSPLKTG